MLQEFTRNFLIYVPLYACLVSLFAAAFLIDSALFRKRTAENPLAQGFGYLLDVGKFLLFLPIFVGAIGYLSLLSRKGLGILWAFIFFFLSWLLIRFLTLLKNTLLEFTASGKENVKRGGKTIVLVAVVFSSVVSMFPTSIMFYEGSEFRFHRPSRIGRDISFFDYLFEIEEKIEERINRLIGVRKEEATVVKIYDGDTVLLNFGLRKDPVRFIGMDAPESSRSDKATRDSERLGIPLHELFKYGEQSTKFLKTMLRVGESVRIEFDEGRRDKYGRLLAYVYTSGTRMINKEMVRGGYAGVMSIPPNLRYREDFEKEFNEAKKNKKGLWAEEKIILENFLWR